MTDDQKLKLRQELGQRVRDRMVEHMLNFNPVRELKVCDVQVIAEMARTHAFEAMADFQQNLK